MLTKGPKTKHERRQFEAITATITANTLTAITDRWLADEIARANAFARADANVLRAVNDLLPKLKRAYGQPARDADAVALLAIAGFLNQMGPKPGDDLAHFADQFARLAQMHHGLDDGIYVLSRAKRSDETWDWLARGCVALAVADLKRRGYTRDKAAKWVAK